jgi:hypothetical protein
LTCVWAQVFGRDRGCMLRFSAVSVFLLALAASFAIATSSALAQSAPNKVPAYPPPPSKALAPAPVSADQYACPKGYVKPDQSLRIQGLKVCLPAGSGGSAASDIEAPPQGGQRSAAFPFGSGAAKAVRTPSLECQGRAGFYACGRNATECCSMVQDNPCFPGSYACKLDTSQGGANRACCVR